MEEEKKCVGCDVWCRGPRDWRFNSLSWVMLREHYASYFALEWMCLTSMCGKYCSLTLQGLGGCAGRAGHHEECADDPVGSDLRSAGLCLGHAGADGQAEAGELMRWTVIYDRGRA